MIYLSTFFLVSISYSLKKFTHQGESDTQVQEGHFLGWASMAFLFHEVEEFRLTLSELI